MNRRNSIVEVRRRLSVVRREAGSLLLSRWLRDLNGRAWRTHPSSLPFPVVHRRKRSKVLSWVRRSRCRVQYGMLQAKTKRWRMIILQACIQKLDEDARFVYSQCGG